MMWQAAENRKEGKEGTGRRGKRAERRENKRKNEDGKECGKKIEGEEEKVV